mmetsp:Transcript_15366/g.51748  ORF Transcript_15366/g.51748 Transcript_15366/m.51748 type:complete len:228 (-) Transcript_15366:48-731(-)
MLYAEASPAEESAVVLAAPAVAEGDSVELEISGTLEQVKIPAGVHPDDQFSHHLPSAVPVTVATAVPADDDLGRQLQQALDADVEDGFGVGLAHLSPTEQKLLNYKWSIKCFAVVDTFGTLLTLVFSSWGFISLVFLAGPVSGFMGARRLRRRYITVYLAFCALKSIYHLALFAITFSVLCLLVMAVQLWVTSIVYKFWKLLGSVGPQRSIQLASPANSASPRFVYY